MKKIIPKIKKISLLVLLFVIIFSCRDAVQKPKEPEQNVSFTKTYQGLIYDDEVLMLINADEGVISGNYFYIDKGIQLKIDGTINEVGVVLLQEYDKQRNRTGLFKGQIEGVTFTGYWTKQDKKAKMDFVFKESSKSYFKELSSYKELSSFNQNKIKTSTDIEKYENYLAKNPNKFNWKCHDQLRHLYYGKGDVKTSLYHSDILFKNIPMNEYTMNCITDWSLKNKEYDELKMKLRNVITDYPQFKYLNAACKIQLGDVYKIENNKLLVLT